MQKLLSLLPAACLAVKIEQPMIVEPWMVEEPVVVEPRIVEEPVVVEPWIGGVHPIYANVNHTVVERFNSIAHQA
jgi:hypothetical protein